MAIGLDGKAPAALDLCERHRKELVKPLEDLLANFGAPLEPTTPRQQQRGVDRPHLSMIPCPMGDTSRSGLQSLCAHILNDHGFDFGPRPSAKFFGSCCPLCGEDGFEQIATHAMYAHPEVPGGAPGMFAEALRKGDPFKVVTKNEERLRKLIRKGGEYGEGA